MNRLRLAASRTFRSLGVRNYRLYFLGQIVSMSGTWMQSVAQAWLVLEITGSGVALGAVTALQFLPTLLLGPWGGLIADRVDKRKLLIWTQSASALLALALGLLAVTHVVTLWMVYALALGLGLVTMIDMPTRQTFVMEMVGREHVTNAVSLNGVIVNASRIVGPAVAGVLIATVGVGICFLVNAGSYVAVIAGLLMMRASELQRAKITMRQRGQLRAGLRYVWRTRQLRIPLLLMAVVGAIAYNFSVVLPLMVRFAFHAGAGAFGVLFSVMGAGAVVGGLAVAAWGKATRRLLAAAAIAMGVFLLLAALAPSLGFELVAMLPIGMASTAFIAMSNSLLQLGATPEMRGRVMGLFAVVFLGTTPIGGPLIGWIAEQFGPRSAMGVAAGVTAAAGAITLLFLRRARPRPIVEEPVLLETAAEGAATP
ncbi:MAG TPA: MFS transporter [Actinomycetota bacterium]